MTPITFYFFDLDNNSIGYKMTYMCIILSPQKKNDKKEIFEKLQWLGFLLVDWWIVFMFHKVCIGLANLNFI